MILAFSGDSFLARRGARRALDARGGDGVSVVELGEGTDADEIVQQARQSGLFGASTLLIDFDAAFQGQGGVAPRNAALKALASVPDETLVVVIDSHATPARQKRWQELGELDHRPTPRFGELRRWIARELDDAGVRVEPSVPALLADLFGEDLPGLASEIQKLAVLDETLGEDRVRRLVARPASRDAFDMIDAIVRGDAGQAVRVAQTLMDAGEPPARVAGALAWQFALVARARGLREEQGEVPKAIAAKELGTSPYPAGRAMALAREADERMLAEVFEQLLDAETALKTGRREPGWAMTALALSLASTFGRGAAP
ncbi:MAG: DNA polymerase III subunit delta [Trueperaceae bacterium]|nr:DNA polymerase III subunit delta [Trueperaceae bacterium]